MSVYVSDWLSSVSSVGVRGSGLVTWSGMSSVSWEVLLLGVKGSGLVTWSGMFSVSWGVLLLLLVVLTGMMLNGVAGLGWYRGGWGAKGSLS